MVINLVYKTTKVISLKKKTECFVKEIISFPDSNLVCIRQQIGVTFIDNFSYFRKDDLNTAELEYEFINALQLGTF